MKIEKFEEIKAWQEARRLTKLVYGLSNKGGFVNDRGLRDQIQRASASIAANIVEGFDSKSRSEFSRFLSYASRSTSEVQAHLYTALDMSYLTETEFAEAYRLAEYTKNLIGGFMRYLAWKVVTEAQKN